VNRAPYSQVNQSKKGACGMFKRLLAIIGLVCAGLAAWPAWADGSGGQRLGTGVPTAIAVSPDGVTLAVGTSVGVWFLSAATLTPLSFWDAGQWVPAVAYSADGRYLRAGDRFYDTTTGAAALLAPADLAWQPLSPAPAHDCAPDGRRCLIYHLDNLVIRDQDTRIDTALLRTGLLFGAAWSPDGRTVYTAVYGGVQAWDAAAATLRQSQTDFFTGSLFNGVHWSADGARVGSGQLAWDIATGQTTAMLACGTENAPTDCAVPYYDIWGGTYMVVYDQDCACRWRALIPHDVWITAQDFSLDGAYLVTSGIDNYQYRCPGGAAQSTARGQCQTHVGSTRLWDSKTFKLLGQLPVRFDAVAISPDGAVVVGATSGALEAWDWGAGRRRWSVAQPLNRLGQLTISPTGDFVAADVTTNNRPAIALWRMATGERVATLTGHTMPDPWPLGRLGNVYGVPWYQGIHMSGLAFSPNGRHLAASSLDGTMLVWPVP
jgi:WD40 repeat protein